MRIIKTISYDLFNRCGRMHLLSIIASYLPGKTGNYIRYKFYSKKFKSCGKNISILFGARFRSPECLTVGDNVAIGEGVYIQAKGGVTLGNNVIIGPGVKIWTVNHIIADSSIPILQQGLEEKEISIGDDVWLASDCFIMPGAQIGEGTVVSAGAIVSGKAAKPYSILAGNPARVIGNRLDRKMK